MERLTNTETPYETTKSKHNNNSKKTFAIIILIALLVLATLANCAPRKYSAAPLSGQVVDKTTGQPIIGAYVVAVYGLNGGLEGTYVAPLHYMETRSGKDGKFRFEGFTDIPVDYSRAPKSAIVMDYDPLLFFFAKGYLPKDAAKNLTSEPSGAYIKSPLDGIVMKLEPMSGDIQKDAERSGPYIGGLEGLLSSGFHNGKNLYIKCTLNKIPETRDYLIRMDKFFEQDAKYTPGLYATTKYKCK